MYLLLAMPLLFCACGDDDDTDYLISVFEENLDDYSNNYVNVERDKRRLSDYAKQLEQAMKDGDTEKEKSLKSSIQIAEESLERNKKQKEERYAVLTEKFPKLIDDVEKYASQKLHFTLTIPINLEYSKVLKKEMEDMKTALIERVRKGDY